MSLPDWASTSRHRRGSSLSRIGNRATAHRLTEPITSHTQRRDYIEQAYCTSVLGGLGWRADGLRFVLTRQDHSHCCGSLPAGPPAGHAGEVRCAVSAWRAHGCGRGPSARGGRRRHVVPCQTHVTATWNPDGTDGVRWLLVDILVDQRTSYALQFNEPAPPPPLPPVARVQRHDHHRYRPGPRHGTHPRR